VIADYIRQGKIIAIKSIGGYQLICDAHNQSAVQKLRTIKSRNSKPFAMMVLNAESAETWVSLKDAVDDLYHTSKPIVLAEKKNFDHMSHLSTGLNKLGIMLPDSPVHYLLFYE